MLPGSVARVDLVHVWEWERLPCGTKLRREWSRETRWESGWCNDGVVFWMVWGEGSWSVSFFF